MSAERYSQVPEIPRRHIQVITRPLLQFMHVESSGGVVLLACTALALFLANSPWAEAYHHFWEEILEIGIGDYVLAYPLHYWINDALMVIFFFVIGLEIKREMVTGELSDPKQITLPIAAALGGVVVPVVIYMWFQYGEIGERGWAVPMATDIAFVVGCLALLGDRIPHGLKILMLSLAIVDDMIAVLVIALFYTDHISTMWLVLAFVGFALTIGLNRAGVREIGVYVVVGVAVWFCMLKSGVHPTIAGVLLGLLTPVHALLEPDRFLTLLDRLSARLRETERSREERLKMVSDLAFATNEVVPPVIRLESALHPWVAFGIMPVFALANAGVAIDGAAIGEPVAVAVAIGLFAGKAIGIFGASWLTIKLGWAAMPTGVRWPALLGAAFLGGIGFTMALFIAALGLEDSLLISAKVGIVVGSFLSACVGMAILVSSSKRSSAVAAAAAAAVLLCLSWPGSADAQPVYYSYVGDSGRTVYVNRLSLVPPEKRQEAEPVDLANVSLNEDLAAGIADAVESEFNMLQESEPCLQAVQEKTSGLWGHVWRRHGAWLLAALTALILLAISPWMIRATPQGVWARFLIVALPALALAGVLAVTLSRARDTLDSVRSLAALCEANEKEATPAKQLLRVSDMHEYIEELYNDQYRQTRALP